MKLTTLSAAVLSLFDRISNSYGTSYDPKSKIATISVPDMGPASLDINSNQIMLFAEAIGSFDPDEKLTLIETVSKTLERVKVKDVESIRFRTSLEKGSRAVVVPVADWPDFVRFWDAAADGTEDLLKRYEEATASAVPPTPQPE